MIRKIIAIFVLICLSLSLMDITGLIPPILGWSAKLQLVPAILSLNLAVIIALIALTLVFGRVYCSYICPLGIFMDVFNHFGQKGKPKRRFHFKYTKGRTWVRVSALVLFVAALLLGFTSLASLIEPYGIFGRIMNNIVSPKSMPTLIIAAIMTIALILLSFFHGRAWCNTICPVGTVLGFLSKFSLYKIRIDEDKCKNCGLCARQCKAYCIDPKEKKIDYSRCVVCLNCVKACSSDAISFTPPARKPYVDPKWTESKKADSTPEAPKADNSRRTFLAVGALALAGASSARAQEAQKLLDDSYGDGGLLPITPKIAPRRELPIKPAGAISLKNFNQHCIACGLCIAACKQKVLRPSTSFDTFMQPEMGFEKGYCLPGCNACSQVCPAGAIKPISIEEKTTVQVAVAKVNLDLCISAHDGEACGTCSRHCPADAITYVKRIPQVNPDRCIGCGKCEHLCPVRPESAITLSGVAVHRTI